jgi:hypothetical protein
VVHSDLDEPRSLDARIRRAVSRSAARPRTA